MGFEHIWAPWRLGYILGEEAPATETQAVLPPGADPACFLCRCAAGGDDRQLLVVERTERAVAVLNRYPYNNGHLLVAPRRHVERLDQLDGGESAALWGLISGMVRRLEEVLRPEGFNVGVNLGRIAGAGLPGHLHWHIVPRWSGDTNFMTTLSGVRVIPQSLEALWEAMVGRGEPD